MSESSSSNLDFLTSTIRELKDVSDRFQIADADVVSKFKNIKHANLLKLKKELFNQFQVRIRLMSISKEQDKNEEVIIIDRQPFLYAAVDDHGITHHVFTKKEEADAYIDDVLICGGLMKIMMD